MNRQSWLKSTKLKWRLQSSWKIQPLESLNCTHFHEAGHAVAAIVLAGMRCNWAIIHDIDSGQVAAPGLKPLYNDTLVYAAGPASEIVFYTVRLLGKAIADVSDADWEQMKPLLTFALVGSGEDLEEIEANIGFLFGPAKDRRYTHVIQQAYALVIALWQPISVVAERLREHGWASHEVIASAVNDDKAWTLPRHLRPLVKRKYVRRLAPPT